MKNKETKKYTRWILAITITIMAAVLGIPGILMTGTSYNMEYIEDFTDESRLAEIYAEKNLYGEEPTPLIIVGERIYLPARQCLCVKIARTAIKSARKISGLVNKNEKKIEKTEVEKTTQPKSKRKIGGVTNKKEKTVEKVEKKETPSRRIGGVTKEKANHKDTPEVKKAEKKPLTERRIGGKAVKVSCFRLENNTGFKIINTLNYELRAYYKGRLYQLKDNTFYY